MADDKVQDRYDVFFDADFNPLIRHGQTQGAEERQAYAAEFTAYKIGKIEQSLERLVNLMERVPAPPKDPS